MNEKAEGNGAKRGVMKLQECPNKRQHCILIRGYFILPVHIPGNFFAFLENDMFLTVIIHHILTLICSFQIVLNSLC